MSIRNGNWVDINWTWSAEHRSPDAILPEQTQKTVFFHPRHNNGTAAIRGTLALNNNRHYWEVYVDKRVFGYSMMVGIGTTEARLHSNHFRHLIGEDSHGWGLNHRGFLWHAGAGRNYMNRFFENSSTKIGVLFDGVNGTLRFYKDDRDLGVAFEKLDEIDYPIFPIVSSTAESTKMILMSSKYEFVNLQERCRAGILKRLRSIDDIHALNLPHFIENFLRDGVYTRKWNSLQT